MKFHPLLAIIFEINPVTNGAIIANKPVDFSGLRPVDEESEFVTALVSLPNKPPSNDFPFSNKESSLPFNKSVGLLSGLEPVIPDIMLPRKPEFPPAPFFRMPANMAGIPAEKPVFT
ncbi:hypothetical protein D3C87_1553890 [compost metagenome]